MSTETIITIVFGLVMGLIGFIWKNVFEARFKELRIRFDELKDALEDHTTKIFEKLDKAQTIDGCKLHHSYHADEHKRVDRDINGFGERVNKLEVRVEKLEAAK